MEFLTDTLPDIPAYILFIGAGVVAIVIVLVLRRQIRRRRRRRWSGMSNYFQE